MPLTATGLTVPTLAEIRASIRAAVAASPLLGPAWQTDTGSILGQIIDVIADRIVDVYDLLLEVYSAFDPDQAEGVQLDALCALTGIQREPQTYSRGTCQYTGAPGTVVPAGTLFRVPFGPIVSSDVAATLDGFGAGSAACTAQDAGAIVIGVGFCTEIVTPVVGLVTVSNMADFVTGDERQTDSSLRVDRERYYVAPSPSTDWGIGAAIGRSEGVTWGRCISDRALNTVWCLAYPNTADVVELGATLWNHVPAGIAMLGAESATVTDSEGNAQIVQWDWVTEIPVSTVVTIGGLAGTPAQIAIVEAAIQAYYDTLTVGDDAIALYVVARILADLVGATSIACTVDMGAVVVAADSEICINTIQVINWV